MWIRVAALAGLAFAGFKMFEKARDEGLLDTGGDDTYGDTWDMIDDEDLPVA